MILLPIPILVRLRLRWLVKLELVGMFSMGFLCVHLPMQLRLGLR